MAQLVPAIKVANTKAIEATNAIAIAFGFKPLAQINAPGFTAHRIVERQRATINAMREVGRSGQAGVSYLDHWQGGDDVPPDLEPFPGAEVSHVATMSRSEFIAVRLNELLFERYKAGAHQIAAELIDTSAADVGADSLE